MKTRRKKITYEVAEGVMTARGGFRVMQVITYQRRPLRGGGWGVIRIKSRRVDQPHRRDPRIVCSLDPTRYPGDGL